MTPLTLWCGTMASPIGAMLLLWDEADRLRALYFEDRAERMAAMMSKQYPGAQPRQATPPTSIADPLHRYFAGDLRALENIAFATNGSAFQQAVWTALPAIRAGETLSYGALARRLGHPAGASRAVGLANGANPVSLVLPCHRIIGANGDLTGYGGGMARKQWLLEHEGVLPAAAQQMSLFA